MQRTLTTLLLLLFLIYPIFAQSEELKQGENSLQMLKISSAVQIVGVKDLMQQIDLTDEQAEIAQIRLKGWLAYLSVLGGEEDSLGMNNKQIQKLSISDSTLADRIESVIYENNEKSYSNHHLQNLPFFTSVLNRLGNVWNVSLLADSFSVN